MKRFNKFTLVVASLVCAITVMSGGVAGAVPVITNGLVAAYEFNGNANDVSGNGNNGVVNGATLTADRFGNTNSAYDFDGVNDIISIGPVLTSSNSLSIFGWIRRGGNSIDSWDDIVAGDAGSPIFGIQNSSQRLGFGGQVNNPILATFDESTLEDSLWHFVGATYDGALVNLYRDGALVASSPRTGSFNTSLSLGIGGAEDHFPEHFSGSIDDVYFYDRALSAIEVSTLYSVIPEPSTALLLGIGLSALAVRREKR
jgi:hypothetical protein